MKFQDSQHDDAILQELGRRLAQVRIDLNLTQVELARRAGIGKRTLERLENGEVTQTRTLIRILREMDLMERLDVLLPKSTLRPSRPIMKADALPKRASRKRSKMTSEKEWQWGDEA